MEATNTPEPPREVVEEFERQLDEWSVAFRAALEKRFTEEGEAAPAH